MENRGFGVQFSCLTFKGNVISKLTMKRETILVGDLGGTKTNLALVSKDSGPRFPLAEGTFQSGEYKGLDEIVSDFLSQSDYEVSRAVLGVAGPVVSGRSTITNLRWHLDEEQLMKKFSMASVRLLNDLVATAYSIPLLEPEDTVIINEGEPAVEGAIAVIAPGTGLGEAFLVWDGYRYQAYPSEGGHADFAPADQNEIEMLSVYQDSNNHVSYEHFCSGRGLPNIYNYYKQIGSSNETVWGAEQIAAADDPAPIIVNGALNNEQPCELCRKTLNTFISILGAEAGNFALKVMATGGLYLGGGIPPRIVDALREGIFLNSFLRKGRMTSLLNKVPIRIITNPKAALLGAAGYGLLLEDING